MSPSASRNTNKPRGKYTNRACQECRRRRAKCDGKKPTCTRCLQGQISCQYSVAEDGRRPASKAYVLLLRQRIESLERLLEWHGIDPRGKFDTEQLSSGRALGSEAKDQQEETDPTVDKLAETFKGRLALDESLNFDGDGEMRYFGPMSGRLRFQSSPDDDVEDASLSAFKHGSRLEGSEYPGAVHPIIDEIGLPKSVQDHLIDLYFTWENPWFAVVDEELFRQSMKDCGKYWSPLLHVCVLAVGSRFSDLTDVRSDPGDQNTAGKVFFEHAKRLFYDEIERPSLTTIQALAILGTFHIAIGGDATGWLHHGTANRLSVDMGLNLDPAGFEETNLLSHREVQLRRQIYWALYCSDKWSANYTGRIFSMLDSQGAVKMPDDDEISDTGSPSRRALRPLQRAMIGISRIQEKIILSLWAPKPLLKDNHGPTFLKTCLLDLRSWLYDLPTELRIDRPNDISHTYTLHMMYHTVRILLARPFIMRESPPSVKKGMDNETTGLALSVCRESARAICLVAQKYRQVFGTFRLSAISATHCTLSAALALLDETENLSSQSHKNKLSLCLMVLDELSKAWHPARHIGRNLRKLCCSATSDGMFSQKSHTLPDTNSLEPPLDLGFDLPFSLDDIEPDLQFSPGNALANQLELSVPMESLPVDYGFFDFLNQTGWDQMP